MTDSVDCPPFSPRQDALFSRQVGLFSDTLTALVPQLTGSLVQLGQAAQTAVSVASTAITNANTQVSLLASASDDYLQAVGTAGNRVSDNDPAQTAAVQTVQAALAALSQQTAVTNAAVQAAASAVTGALGAVTTLASATAGVTDAALKATVAGLQSGLNTLSGALSNAAGVVATVVVDVSNVAITAATTIVGVALGVTVGELFEFFAGGDIVMPSGGGAHNFQDYGVATHEYGHYILCNLLDSASPSGMVTAYDQAAAQAFAGQQPESTAAVINEAFADLIASQVVGGTDYANPPDSKHSLDGLMNFCSSTNSETIACIDTNVTNDIVGPASFPQEVLRDVTLFSDAFDSVGPVPAHFDGPTNGNEWTQNGSGQLLLGASGYGASDELITLPAVNANPNAFGTWISHIFDRGTFLPRTPCLAPSTMR